MIARARIVSAYRACGSMTEIAKRFHLSRERVRQIVKKQTGKSGVEILSESLNPLIRAAVTDPAISTFREAAAAVGIKVPAFKRHLRSLGLFELAQAEFQARRNLRVYHGTLRRYRGSQTRPACHCAQCRRAHTDYWHRMMEARRARTNHRTTGGARVT
jgi:hypothetical protein